MSDNINITVHPCTAEQRAAFRASVELDEVSPGKYDTADQMFLSLLTGYWSPAYGRGDWPTIQVLLRRLLEAFPNAVVKYFGDTSYDDATVDIVSARMIRDFRKAWFRRYKPKREGAAVAVPIFREGSKMLAADLFTSQESKVLDLIYANFKTNGWHMIDGKFYAFANMGVDSGTLVHGPGDGPDDALRIALSQTTYNKSPLSIMVCRVTNESFEPVRYVTVTAVVTPAEGWVAR